MVEPASFADFRGRLPRVDGIAVLDSAEALECSRRGAVFVDLREAYETNFRVFDVERVIYLPWSKWASSGTGADGPAAGEWPPKDRPLVIADAAGIYARSAARLLRESGYANIAYLAGGMLDWCADGMPVRRDDDYELRGQCACKMKTRHGGNPLTGKAKEGV